MSLTTILIVLLVIVLLGAFPFGASYNRSWGYGPSGVILVILLIIVVFAVAGWV